MGLLKELHRQHRGQAAEYIEVIPLDDVADRCGDDHLSKVLRDLRPSHIEFLPVANIMLPACGSRTSRKEEERPSCLQGPLVVLQCNSRPLPIETRRSS